MPLRQRIALLRALRLGDMLCSVPAIRSLRRMWPEAEITLLGMRWASRFSERYPAYIDRFMHLPGYPGFPEQEFEERELADFIDRVREEQYDLIIQMHGDGSISNKLVAELGGRLTAGFYPAGAEAPNPGTYITYPGGFA